MDERREACTIVTPAYIDGSKTKNCHQPLYLLPYYLLTTWQDRGIALGWDV
jgi:hypothetical protein